MRWIGLVGMLVVGGGGLGLSDNRRALRRRPGGGGLALALARNRGAIRWRAVGWAFALQLAFAAIVLYWETGKNALEAFSNKVSSAIGYADKGSGFLFGWLAGPMDDLG